MKKMFVIVMTMVFILSLSLPAMASNGKGKGLENAPGQDSNFSKGITTVVATSQAIIESIIVDVQTSEVVWTEAKSNTSETIDIITTATTTENHNEQSWYRDLTTATTETTTITETWDETTTATTTRTTETSVATAEMTETTVLHRGSPVSNGKVLGENSATFVDSVEYGEPVSTETTVTTVTSGEVTISIETTNDTATETGIWRVNGTETPVSESNGIDSGKNKKE